MNTYVSHTPRELFAFYLGEKVKRIDLAKCFDNGVFGQINANDL